MEELKFKCKDEVLCRMKNPEDSFHYWSYGIFSHYQPGYKGEMMACINGSLRFLKDCDIIPYKGNESLVGTTSDVDEEIVLTKGTYVMAIDSLVSPVRMSDWNLVCWTGQPLGWRYIVKFEDFNPRDITSTIRKALQNKNGKFYKYCKHY